LSEEVGISHVSVLFIAKIAYFGRMFQDMKHSENYICRKNRSGGMIKKDEATEAAPNLMFSQRNNPYCELLHYRAANIQYFF
jgi:hypothetical protein